MRTERIVIVGGPCRSKSTYAERHFSHIPTFCTDTRSVSRSQYERVTYMPDHITDWSEQSQHVADHWLMMPGPWVIEGVATARALRKWVSAYDNTRGDPSTDPERMPCDRIIVFRHAHPEAEVSAGQERMAKGVWSVWCEIESRFREIVEYR